MAKDYDVMVSLNDVMKYLKYDLDLQTVFNWTDVDMEGLRNELEQKAYIINADCKEDLLLEIANINPDSISNMISVDCLHNWCERKRKSLLGYFEQISK